MTFVDTNTVSAPPTMQLEEIKPIKTRKPREQKHDFKDGQGRVPARRHINGKGWVANTAVVEDSVYVGPTSEVFQRAYVAGKARLEGKARVSGTATIHGNVLLKQHAQVYGEAVIRDNTTIGETARVCGRAHISGGSRVLGNAIVSDCAQIISGIITGRSAVTGYALVVRGSLSGDVVLRDNCVVINSTLHGNIEIKDFGQVLSNTNLRNSNSSHSIIVCNYAILADNTELWSPIVFKQHAVACRARISCSIPHDQARLEVGGNIVLQQNRISNYAELQALVTALANPMRPNTAVPQPGAFNAVPGFPVRNLNHLDTANRPRRVQRLQEAAV